MQDLENNLTLTQTLSSINNVVSLPGYSLLDLDADLNIDEHNSKLGEGGTATIYKCTFRKLSLLSKYSFNEVAVKLLKTNNLEAIDLIKFEIAIMSSIPPHQNVIQFVGYSESPYSIVMKYYPNSLKDLMAKAELYGSKALRMKIAHDIALGMVHIHKSGVLHLDLKPRKF